MNLSLTPKIRPSHDSPYSGDSSKSKEFLRQKFSRNTSAKGRKSKVGSYGKKTNKAKNYSKTSKAQGSLAAKYQKSKSADKKDSSKSNSRFQDKTVSSSKPVNKLFTTAEYTL